MQAIASVSRSDTRDWAPAGSLAAFAAALSLSSAIAHFGAALPHFAEWWAHGVFFVVCGVMQTLLAVLILRGAGEIVALAGIAGNLAIIAMYVYSRTNGVPFGPHRGVPEEPGIFDMVTTAGEFATVVALWAMLGPRSGRWAMRLIFASGAGLWVARATGFVL